MSSVRYAYKNDDVYKGILNKLVSEYIREQIRNTGMTEQQIRQSLSVGIGMKPNDDMADLEDNAKLMYDAVKRQQKSIQLIPVKNPQGVFRRIIQAGGGVISDMRRRQREFMKNMKVKQDAKIGFTGV
jgi:hypothetical protein